MIFFPSRDPSIFLICYSLWVCLSLTLSSLLPRVVIFSEQGLWMLLTAAPTWSDRGCRLRKSGPGPKVWEAGEKCVHAARVGLLRFAVALHTPTQPWPGGNLTPILSSFLCILLLSSIDYQHLRDKQGFHSALNREERVGVSQPTAAHTPLLINIKTSCLILTHILTPAIEGRTSSGTGPLPRLSLPLCDSG